MNRAGSSRLVRRLRRHRGIGVLFPSAERGAYAPQAPRSGPAPAEADLPIVQARLSSPGDGLPGGYAFEAPPDIQDTTAASPVQPSAPPVSPPPLRRTPQPPPRTERPIEMRQEPEAEESTFSENLWRRLGAIMSRHERKSEDLPGEGAEPAAGEAHQTEAGDAPPVQRQIAAGGDREAQRPRRGPVEPVAANAARVGYQDPSGEPEVGEAPGTQDVTDGSLEPVEHAGQPRVEATEREWSIPPSRRLEVEMDLPPFLERREAESQPQDAEKTPDAYSLASKTADFSAQAGVDPHHERVEAGESPVGSRDALQDSLIEVPPASPGAPVQRTPAGQTETAEAGEANLPLEAVWPVQLSRSGQQAPRDEPSDDRPAYVQAEGDPHVRRMVAEVPSGEKSDSPIEWVSPSRPRPVTTRAALQRKPADELPERAGLEGIAPPDNVAGAEMPGLLEAPEIGDVRLGGARVETEIGPLPGDLWQLIGAEPPARLEAQSEGRDANVDDRPDAGDVNRASPVIQRTLSDEPVQEGPTLELASASFSTPGSDVQRAVRVDDAPAGEDGSETENAQAVDTDAIARQVYARLRSRLAVEWERLRGRT